MAEMEEKTIAPVLRKAAPPRRAFRWWRCGRTRAASQSYCQAYDHLEVAHLHAAAQVRTMRRHRHGFHAAGNDDLGVTRVNLLHAECHRAEAPSRRAGSRPRPWPPAGC